MATIYEVSKLAGVSLATVSRVINNNDKVKPNTRQKVLKAMEDLNYFPNSIAQSLATRCSNSVGVLIPELHGPFFGIMLSHIEAELRDAGKHVMIMAGHSDEAREKESLELLLSRNCDALILHVYSLTDEYLLNLSNGPVPIVLLNRLVAGMEDRCISLDNEHGGYIATKTLLELGHKSVAYISGPHWKMDSFKRIRGHKRALAEFGLEFDQRLMFEGTFEEESGKAGMEQLLQSGIPFTGVVCANDEMAAGAYNTARKHGLKIPDDMSIIGYDDVAFARYLYPKLSSVTCHIDQMGLMAARNVLKYAYGKDSAVIQNIFKPSVMLRASVNSV